MDRVVLLVITAIVAGGGIWMMTRPTRKDNVAADL